VAVTRITGVTVIMYKPVVDQFRGWNGPIGRSTLRLVKMARTEQIALVGKFTGHLAASITVGPRTRWARGIQTTVGASAGQRQSGLRGYAMANDQGARPHIIRPRKPGGMLFFYWAKVGHTVSLRSVRHPGNRAYHWAERGMAAAMAIWQRSG
jgi:hypothetical protein